MQSCDLLSTKIGLYKDAIFDRVDTETVAHASHAMASQSSTGKPQELEQKLEKKMLEIAATKRLETAQSLAQKLGLPFSDLTGIPIDPEALTIVPEQTARDAGLAVISKSGATLVIVTTDPQNPKTRAEIERLQSQGLTVSVFVTTSDALSKAWERYGTIKTTEVFEIGAVEINEEDLQQLQAQISTIADLKQQITKVSVTKLLEILLAGALKIQASDIHFEPQAEHTRLRYRLDGLLQDVTMLDTEYYHKLLSRLKVLSKLKLNVHKIPQDGRFTIREKDIAIEVRVSVLPSEYGETVVMRLLDPRTIRKDLKDLGMRPDILAQVQEQLAKPNGTLMTTGPTGSGKTTTLYAFVSHLNTPDVKIITIEDPIEYHIEGISQTQVDPSKGYTFESGLRSIVRQDPDVILVGEIRDFETADIALNAALTGHLVLSTIHTNDAAGTIPRLIDLGVKPEMIAPALTMAMGQRLLRQLCSHCKIAKTIPSDELKKIQEAIAPIQERFKLPAINIKTTIYIPGTCVQCNQLGYKGRIGVYEVFTITRAMEKLILNRPAMSDIRDLAIQEGMVTMLQDGYLKLLDGTTSLEEIRRILG